MHNGSTRRDIAEGRRISRQGSAWSESLTWTGQHSSGDDGATVCSVSWRERDSKTRKARTPPRHVTRYAMPRPLWHALPSGQCAQHPPGT
eukprot:984364-Prymnesium_polylepis.1